MVRYLIMIVSVSLSALGMVSYLDENPKVIKTAAIIATDQIESRATPRPGNDRPDAAHALALSGTERLRVDAQGHYVAQFSLNARRVTGIIDTGATMIAMNRSEARRAGIHVTANDFVYRVNTANGEARAARAMIDEVRLGTIRVRNVEAMILEDDALRVVLIGMSFLNRLKNFEFSNGTLEMKL